MSLQSRLSELITAIGNDIKRYHGVLTQTTIATLTPSAALNQFNLTAQAGALVIANPSGSPLDGQSFLFRIKDNGTARGISWGANYRGVGVTLPNTTVIGKTLYIGGKWNAADTKVDIIAIGQEA